MSDALLRHDALVRTTIERNGGYVFKTLGDGFYSAFACFDDAVATAIEAQSRIQYLVDTQTLELPLRVRIVLHVGAPIARDRDYVGPVVNRAARLLKVARGGQTLLSEAAAMELRRAIPSSVLEDAGLHQLRGLADPEHVFQLPMARNDSLTPPETNDGLSEDGIFAQQLRWLTATA
jgi:class 3 adenylate cyclase